MSHPLQNNPGSKRFPVEGFSWIKFKELSFARRVTSLILVLFGLLFFLSLLGPIMIVLGIWIVYSGTSRLKREQKKYYKLGKMETLGDEQLQALQLGTFNSFACHQWTDTLETWPCEQRIGDQSGKFKFLKVILTKNLVHQLEKSWGIISKTDYEDSYSSLIGGLHTKRFVRDYYFGEEKKQMVQRLCGLTQTTDEQFHSIFENVRGPQKLIWAWDLWRAVAISRLSYECGFIDEGIAWKNILQASDYAHTLYDNLDEFFLGVRIGHAYWCNDFKLALERKEELDNFMNPEDKHKHRVHNVGWSKKKVQLPKNMQTGFEELKQELSKSLDQPRPQSPMVDQNFKH